MKQILSKVKHLSKKLVFLLSALLITGALIGVYLYFFSKPASASWFDDNWLYRKAIPIATHTAAENNVYITLSNAKSMAISTSDTTRFQTDCGDLRFTKQNGEILPYYIVSGCGTSDTIIHVFFDSFPAGAQTIYMYYGNPSAKNGSEVSDFTTEASNYTFSTLASEEQGTGPVAYWKFDDAQGTTAQDSSSSNNDGTISGATWTQENQCISGKCLSFDGGDYADAGTSPSLQPAQFTLSAWIKVNSNSSNNYQAIISNSVYGDYYGYAMAVNSNNQLWASVQSANSTTYTSGGATSGYTLQKNTWYHVAVSYTPDAYILYVNGVQVASVDPVTIAYEATDRFRVGTWAGSPDTGAYFNGFIDDVKIYPYARTAAQIKADYAARGSSKGAAAVMGQAAQSTLDTGPVGYWDFEEGSGAAANDKSGQGNNGTWSGTGTHWTAGKYGKAGKFNGSDDYTSVGDSSSLGFGTGSFTAEAWVKTSTTEGGVFGKYKITGGEIGWSFELTSGYLRSYLYKGSGSATDTTGTILVNDGKWHHVVLVRDSTNSKIYQYVDGVQNKNVTDNTAGSTLDSNTALRIGDKTETTWNEYFNGLIDDVKIYNYARTPSQILADMGTGQAQKQPVGYWKFDEGQGTTANNFGNGGSTLNGTLTGMSSPATATSGWTSSGKFGKALIFDGSNDYVNIPYNSGINPSSVLTVSLWIYHNADSSSLEVPLELNQGGTSDEPYYILYRGDLPSKQWDYGIEQSNGTYIQPHVSSSTVGIGEWKHIVMVADGTNIIFYVNGVKQNSTSYNGTLKVNSAATLNIGSFGSGRYFNGSIDEVKIYNYALTADEVKTEYNQGQSLQLGALGNNTTYQSGAANQQYCVPGDTTSCVAPVAEWNFEEGSGTSVKDTSGNNNTGTWNGTGTKHWDTGKIGKAGKFNGSDDYVGLPNDLRKTDSAGTIEAWVKFNGSGSGGSISPIVDLGGTASNSFVFALRRRESASSGCSTNTLELRVNPTANNDVCGSTTLNNGTWYHVAVSGDGSSYKMYVNGIPETITMGVGSNNGSWLSSLSFGQTTTTSIGRIWFNGSSASFSNANIDQVRIYNYARSAAQIAWDYNRGAPVGHWQFDECQGSVAHDFSGNSNHGTITIGASGEDTLGTCTTSSTAWGSGATGKYNSSLSFDGTDDYINTGSGSSLNFGTGSLTMSAWIKTTSSTLWAGIIGRGTSNNGLYQMTMNSSGGVRAQIYDQSANGVTADSTSTVNNDNWHHVVAVFNRGDMIYLYKDGRADGQTSASVVTGSVTPQTSTDPLYIGSERTNASFFNGQIDDVKVFNYALTATQIKTLFNNGAVNFGPVTGTP